MNGNWWRRQAIPRSNRLLQQGRPAGSPALSRRDVPGRPFPGVVGQRLQYLEGLDGKLLLLTNTDAPAAEVVQRYKSLADIERGFRALKSDIEIGSVYHRLPRRIRAHALVCFIALVLHRVLRMRLKASNRPESPMRLLEQLRRIQYQTAQTGDGQLLRGLTELGAVQKELFAAVGLPAPTPDGVSPTKPEVAPPVSL